MEKTLEIAHELTFDRPVEEVWTLLSDSQRMHVISSAGFSPYEAEDVVTADGSIERAAVKSIGPFKLRWRERMGEWAVHEYFSQARLFESGPFQELTVHAYFDESDGKTTIKALFFAKWSGLLGSALARLGVLHWMTRQPVIAMRKTMAEYENLRLPVPRSELHTVSGRAKQRLAQAMKEIEKGPFGQGLTEPLSNFLLKADPHSLRRIRPLKLAGAWAVPEQHMIELCIAAHKAGVLSMRWAIICPRCRDGKADTENLADVPSGAHCTSCNVDFDRDFVNNVELVFSPSAWLRALPSGSFCMMAPANVPHIKWQEVIPPGQVVDKELDVPQGQYRIRTVEAGSEIIADYDGRSWVGVTLNGEAVQSDPARSGRLISVRNVGTDPRTIVVENANFSRNRLTIGRLATVPAFRDFCPDQLLGAKQTAGIGQVAILFSDLEKSTSLYESIGDASAYALVVEHFDFVETRVRRHGGIIVKTIGDAVMAAFSDSEAALNAALDIQNEIGEFNARDDRPALSLKIGIHEGTCVAMRSEQGLDFFGGTINMAARLQSKAAGKEIVLSADLARSDLRTKIAQYDTKWDKASLSGFEKPVEFVRLHC
ncbi:adenylate/guanylate cyclase domain-containing protein [Sulfitobacter aestuariivivens]|uniref:Adenylate/guanylate cyclase domain-containing protein n=1 Tax=Sulfitobacter aestuariivivens TaxID=2766981 RepID=A0A927HEE5_9RHOB|nr:adenylate/guanylate cyclase domain-containing protein [Sulfitobacter aestuariivivens]MBD3663806.1 adenylate/guanylate cyclase domain-containing protein [Sulfitobacter aestuariivivens]